MQQSSFYTVYVLYSAAHDKIYIGCTSALIQRFYAHNQKGQDRTARYRPWEVMHTELYLDKSLARKRERALKSGQGRAWVRKEVLSIYAVRVLRPGANQH